MIVYTSIEYFERFGIANFVLVSLISYEFAIRYPSKVQVVRITPLNTLFMESK